MDIFIASDGHRAGYPEPNRGTVKLPEKNCRNRDTAGKKLTKELRAGLPRPPVPRNRTEPVPPAQRFLGTGTGRFTRHSDSLEPIKN